MTLQQTIKSLVPLTKLALRAQLRENELGLLCPCGIGDTYFACALAAEISRANNNLPIVAVVKQNHRDIPQLFPDSIARIVTYQSRQIVNSVAWSRNLAPGKLFFAHPSVKLAGNSCDLDIIGYKKLNLLDLYKFAFQLDIAAPLSSPKVPEDNIDAARQRINDYGLPLGQTVILAPDSNTTPNFSDLKAYDFWQLLSQQLLDCGYTVVALTNKSRDFLPQIPRVDFPLIEAIPFAEMCGWVIASRSGLCDLLATAKTKLTILYPDCPWYSGTVYSCSSLSLMGLSKSVTEIAIPDSSPAQETIEQITASNGVAKEVIYE